MKYFIDTEFVFTSGAGGGGIDPLSLAIVRETGEYTYFAVPPMLVSPSVQIGSFVDLHVLPVIDADGHESLTLPMPEWSDVIRAFIGDDTPEFWGDYAAFDYVVLSIVMGGFERWPDGWPMFFRDFQQLGIEMKPSAVPHNALADARALYETWNATKEHAPS